MWEDMCCEKVILEGRCNRGAEIGEDWRVEFAAWVESLEGGGENMLKRVEVGIGVDG
jgi:hypothetical protein